MNSNNNIYGLTDEELLDCEETWKTFHKYKSNSIDAEELKNLLEEIGLRPSDSVLTNIFLKYDFDKSGTIEFCEFVEIYKEIKNQKPCPDDILSAFKECDKDQKGSLDFEELKILLETKNDKISEAEAERIFKFMDLNKDGKISFEEFSKVMEYQD